MRPWASGTLPVKIRIVSISGHTQPSMPSDSRVMTICSTPKVVLGAELNRGVVESPHRVLVGGLERDVNLAVGSQVRVGDPELGLAVPAVPDGHPEVHLPRIAEHAEHPVVGLGGFAEIAAVDAEVVYHGAILTLTVDP